MPSALTGTGSRGVGSAGRCYKTLDCRPNGAGNVQTFSGAALGKAGRGVKGEGEVTELGKAGRGVKGEGEVTERSR